VPVRTRPRNNINTLTEDKTMFKRISYFSYGVIAYGIFFLTFLYAIGFVGDIVVPKTLDGTATTTFVVALLVNTGLLGLFAVQHSVMARPAFKRWWTQYVPKPVERSTYTLFSSIALIALFVLWQPMGGVVWQVNDPVAQGILYAGFGFGWLLVLVATFLINHFDLFGLRQVWLYLIGREYTPLQFKTPWLYKYVRHPLYVGWFFAFWATPTMTVTHLLFAIATTAYILIAIQLEERDLVKSLPEYKAYRKRVPMLIPRFAKRAHNPDTAITEQA
jgi:protein-S-isoprenylcysteine O-methyltransferase Ste14